MLDNASETCGRCGEEDNWLKTCNSCGRRVCSSCLSLPYWDEDYRTYNNAPRSDTEGICGHCWKRRKNATATS